jgi:hypothetical protein
MAHFEDTPPAAETEPAEDSPPSWGHNPILPAASEEPPRNPSVGFAVGDTPRNPKSEADKTDSAADRHNRPLEAFADIFLARILWEHFRPEDRYRDSLDRGCLDKRGSLGKGPLGGSPDKGFLGHTLWGPVVGSHIL